MCSGVIYNVECILIRSFTISLFFPRNSNVEKYRVHVVVGVVVGEEIEEEREVGAGSEGEERRKIKLIS